MLRNSIHDLWSEITWLILEKESGVDPSKGATKEQIDLAGKKVWSLMTKCAPKEDSSDKSGTAFWVGWGRCDITEKEVAELLNKQFEREGKLKKRLKIGNIKRYYNFIRHKIKECILSQL